MKVIAVSNINSAKKADYIILPFLEGKKGPIALCGVNKFSKLIKGPIHSKDFIGKTAQISVVYGNKGSRIMLLGLGMADKISEILVSEVYAEAIAYLKKQKADLVNIIIPEKLNISKGDLTKAVAEALFLSNYNFDKFKHFTKKDSPGSIKTACLIGADEKSFAIINERKIVAEGVNLARDLINNNADDETPENLAKAAVSFEEISKDVKVTVFNKKKIEEEKMGLLLAVSKGSDKEPVFIIINYDGDASSKERSVIVGKAITFDTGGLCLKPAGSMDTMKADMSGAAAILGTIYAVARLKLKVNITALIPATENSIGPSSYKPGDVYVGVSKKSVEVKNTDAEGRLILADALSYAVLKIKPDRIIDLATLTGSCVVALGENIAGLFCNSEKLSEELLLSSKRSGDLLWRMPLFEDYKNDLKSEIADLKNVTDKKTAGAITAALFLEEFVDNIPWAHIDIAGPAFKCKPKGLHPTSATGIGVRLLTDFFKNLSK